MDVSGPDDVESSPGPLDPSTLLPQPFPDDPADQIIVATAREENATLLTNDELIRTDRHVRSVW
jgi:PIN domain nuclease of toxin-antitoxin system